MEYKLAPRPPLTYEFSSIKDFYLDQQVAAQLLGRFRQLILPVFYVVSLLTNYIILLLAALLSGTLAMLLGGLQNKPLTYSAGLRLSVTAFTPPLIISSLLALIERPIPFYLYPLLAGAYLLMAVGPCREVQQSDHLYLDDEPVTR